MEGLEKLDSLYKWNKEKQVIVINDVYQVEITQASKSGNCHHAEKTFYIKENNMYVAGFTTMSNPAGCATLILYATEFNQANANIKSIVLKIFDLYKTLEYYSFGGQVSQLLTVFGSAFYNYPSYKFLTEELGFKVISEYKNLAHPKTNDTQRLLQLLL